MPCCRTVLSAAAAVDSSTPSWLRRLHTKGGLSFPSNLRIDDLHPPPPPPPPSSDDPPRRSTNPSRPIPITITHPPPPPQQQQQQQQLPAVVSDLIVVPSSAPPPTKAMRKQTQPRAKPKKPKKAVKKRRRGGDGGADGDGEGCKKTEVTVIDSSIEGWKAGKVVIRRGAVWKIRDIKKPVEAAAPVDSSKAKRRAGLVSKIKRDREREREKHMEIGAAATSSGNIHANSGDMMKEPDGPIEALKRLRCSEPEPEGQIRAILH